VLPLGVALDFLPIELALESSGLPRAAQLPGERPHIGFSPTGGGGVDGTPCGGLAYSVGARRRRIVLLLLVLLCPPGGGVVLEMQGGSMI